MNYVSFDKLLKYSELIIVFVLLVTRNPVCGLSGDKKQAIPSLDTGEL
jgi:hypothetical protein